MVINSTNINKTNNRLSKEKQKKTMIYDFGNPGPGLGQSQDVAGIKQLMRSQLSLFALYYYQYHSKVY